MATATLIDFAALSTALTAADDARLDALSGAATATVAAAGANDAAILATSAAGIIPAPDLASIPTTPGLYRTLDTGYVYERLVGGGDPERREYLEAAARTAVEAAQLVADTAKNAVGANLAALSMRGQADGAQLADGSRWLWQASGTPDGALIVAASDGGVWVRELGPGSLISVNWFASAGGVMDQAALTRWTNYARVNGGRFVLMPGTEATGHITLNQPAKYLTVAAHGARLTATNTANPAILIQEAYAGGDIAGLSIRHAGIGMSPPLSDLDPRRTPGGHGLMVIGGRNWNFVGNSFQGVASMAMLLIALDGFSVTANNIDVAMGDGIHAAFGSRRGTIANNNIRHTGDDGIPVVSPRLWPAGIPASVGTAGQVAPTCADIAVTGNTVVNSAARGICLAGGERIAVTGNVINTTRKAGMILMRDEVNDTLPLTNSTVTGNHVAGAGTYNNTTSGGRAGIWVRAGASNLLLEANHVHDSAEEGILIQDAPAVVVQGGYVHDNTLEGLRIVGTLSGNTVVTGGSYRTNRNGIQAETSCEISGVLAQENRGDGVIAIGSGVVMAVLNSIIRNNGTAGNEQASAAAGATLELHNTRVRGTRLYGLVANDGSTVRAFNCDLRGSGTTATVAAGTGIMSVQGGPNAQNALGDKLEVLYRPRSLGYTWTVNAGGNPHPNGDTGRDMWDGVLTTSTDYLDAPWAGFGNTTAPLVLTHTVAVPSDATFTPTYARAYVLNNAAVGIYRPSTMRLESLVNGVWQVCGTANLTDPGSAGTGWVEVTASTPYAGTGVRLVMTQADTSREFIFVAEIEIYGR